MPCESLGRCIETLVVTSLGLALLALPVPRAKGQAVNPEPPSKPAANDAKSEAKQPASASSSGSKARTPLPLADVVPFSESTTVQGKPGVDLKGVWLLVALPELAPGKFKTFPQLLRITQGKSGLEVHLLDVQLPDPVKQSVDEADRTMAAWVPSDEARKLLAHDWSRLPMAKQKTVGEPLYGKIDYLVVSPDHYSDAFAPHKDAVDKALEGSKLGMKITEDYKPRNLPADSHVAQMMQRITFYGVKTEEKDVLKGDLSVGFLAAGAGTPLPYEFKGPFAMYRIAPG